MSQQKAASGALSGAVSYLAQGAIATATGQSFHWSVQDFAVSVGFGAVTGAAFGGAGYGIGKFAPRIFGFGGEQLGAGDDPAGFWAKSTFDSPEESLATHLRVHGAGRSAAQYTQDALTLRDLRWGEGRLIPIGGGPGRTFGSIGWKIPGETGGIYTLAGKFVSFWYD